MAEINQLTVLQLFKLDLGIKNASKDAYFESLITASAQELERKGIQLDKNCVEDAMLLADYAAWNYRKREENVPLPTNLVQRIRNRIVSVRARREV